MISTILIGALLLAPTQETARQGLGLPTEASAPVSTTEITEEMDLTELSLEDLMAIEITVATRSASPLDEVPAAVYVLTGDEIRRSGHSSVQEALRMVPGMYISRWTTAHWDVTARGFGTNLAFTNSAYLNQLMVMIDGVVVYSPLYAGTTWALQDLVIEEIDRIEIVRGPGGTLWGSNAVHGVVHIITKHSSETPGMSVNYRAGRDDVHSSWRGGGKVGEHGSYRVWGKGAEYDTLANRFDPFEHDYRMNSVGGRFDWAGEDRTYSFWGRVYEGTFDELGYELVNFDPVQVKDHRVGTQLFASTTDVETGAQFQAWFYRNEQDLPTFADIRMDTYDIEYQRPFQITETNLVTIGLGYRRIESEITGDDVFYYDFHPRKVYQNNLRVFTTSTMQFEKLNSSLTLGVTAERNQFTDFELQPTLRYTWTPDFDFMMWAGLSRAVRTPSLEERTLSQASLVAGNDDFRSETLLAYELGMRGMPTDWMSVDLALFYNDYDHLSNRDDSNPNVPLYENVNNAYGHSYGAELAMDFQVTPGWKLRSAYSYEGGLFKDDSGVNLETDEQSPRHSFNVRSYYDLTDEWELDLGFYVIEGVEQLNEIADYRRLDARVGWNPTENFRFYIGVQDAFNPYRSEYDQNDLNRRSAYFGISIGR